MYVSWAGGGEEVGVGWGMLHGAIALLDVGLLASPGLWLRMGAAVVLPVVGGALGDMAQAVVGWGGEGAWISTGEAFTVASANPMWDLALGAV